MKRTMLTVIVTVVALLLLMGGGTAFAQGGLFDPQTPNPAPVETTVPKNSPAAAAESTYYTGTEERPVMDDYYCDDCGEPESVCRDKCLLDTDLYCDDCGREESVCRDTCRPAKATSSAAESIQIQKNTAYHDDDDDRYEYCEDCGKLESECRDTCGLDTDLYCDDCGKLESECRDRCDD